MTSPDATTVVVGIVRSVLNVARVGGAAGLEAVADACEVEPDVIVSTQYGVYVVPHGTSSSITSILAKCYDVKSFANLRFACMVSQLSDDHFVPEYILNSDSNGYVVVGSVMDGFARLFELSSAPEAQLSDETLGAFMGASVKVLRDAYGGLRPVGSGVHECLTRGLMNELTTSRHEDSPFLGYIRYCADFISSLSSHEREHYCQYTISHGDLTVRNVLHFGSGLRLVDFEYSHLGCLWSELGKTIVQSGYLERGSRAPVVTFLNIVEEVSGIVLDREAVRSCALAWSADYRWIASAAERGRPDVVNMVNWDLTRIELIRSGYWIWSGAW